MLISAVTDVGLFVWYGRCLKGQKEVLWVHPQVRFIRLLLDTYSFALRASPGLFYHLLILATP